MAHTNDVVSLRSMLKRGHQGTLHHFTEKYLYRYIDEFASRHHDCETDTIDIVGGLVEEMGENERSTRT